MQSPPLTYNLQDVARAELNYDVIIIGAGTAGSVLANRLSAYPNLSVLVLEAGEDRNHDPNVYTPGLAHTLLDDDAYSWRLTTEAEPGLSNRQIKHPRGKVVGGSSAINSFALLYPNRAGVDVWETMGCEGWNWQTLQPNFEKFQTVCEPASEVREQLSLAHTQEAVLRTNGQLQTSFPVRVEPLQKAWVETWRNLGLENRNNAFEGDAVGGHTSVCHISSDRKERSHAGEAFLMPVAGRENLSIVTGALVEKIVFLKQDNKATATGVHYTKVGRSHFVRGSRVVLAAGSLSSPALLELSGIGDRRRLSELDIPLIYHNAAVGENLQDHIRAGISFEADEGVPRRSQRPEKEARAMYEKDRSGPWGEAACWAFSYMPLLPFMDADEQADWKKVLNDSFASEPPSSAFEEKRNLFIQKMLLSDHEATATAYLSRKSAVPIESTAPGDGTDTPSTNWITLFAMLAHPLSRGSVHITSSSPCQKPKINGNYYSHALDLEVHARILKALEKVAATHPLSKYLKSGGKRAPPLKPESSLDDVKASLRRYASTNYHPVGTCSMLPEETGGAVDSRLRVYGTENLYVVDASIMPVIPRGNVISTVYALAEKAAEQLVEDMGLVSDAERCKVEESHRA